MRPLRLKLKGFRGILDGMGRTEIDLDFASLAGDAPLVALAGANGRGKTTIMDNMHPFPVMPSRAGADGLGAFSYYDQISLPESIKDLEWSYDGQIYRTQMVFRVNGKKKTEAYLHIQVGDTWKPVQLPDGTVSDGKVDNYLRCLEGVIGSQDTFFVSAFSAQGKRQLSAFKNAEIKSLMGDLLGHEEIRALGAQSAEVAKLLKSGLASLRQDLATLGTEEGQVVVKRAALGDPAARISALESARAQQQDELDAARLALARLVAERDVAAHTEARRAQLASEQAALVSEGRTTLGQLDAAIEREQNRLDALTQRASQRVVNAKKREQQLTMQRDRHLQTLNSAQRIVWAQKRLRSASQVVGHRDAQLQRAQALTDQVAQLVAVEKATNLELATIEREAGQAVLRANDLSRRFGLTAAVPCAGTDLQGRCTLLGDAMEAKSLQPSADADIARLDGRRATSVAQIATVREQLGAVLAELQASSPADAQLVVKIAKKRLDTARERRSRLSILAARQGEMEQAATALAGVDAELCALRAESTEETPAEAQERAAATASIASLSQQRDATSRQFRDRYDQVANLVAALPAPFAADRVNHAESVVLSAARALEGTHAAHQTAIRDQQIAAELDGRLLALRNQVGGMQARLAHVEDELAHWNLFTKCMSNDGLVALLIDDAGPALAALANELLLACHGPRFTVSIKTQVSTDKGELKEGFDIVVFDAEANASKSVRDMSGGQKVWINECLIRAIALYLARNSGRKFETLWCDEADGPLDPEHKRVFMAMKREVLRIGGYRQEYFVSQTPELTALADVVIDLDQFVCAPSANTQFSMASAS
jgi:exonuclease SbcC